MPSIEKLKQAIRTFNVGALLMEPLDRFELKKFQIGDIYLKVNLDGFAAFSENARQVDNAKILSNVSY